MQNATHSPQDTYILCPQLSTLPVKMLNVELLEKEYLKMTMCWEPKISRLDMRS